MHIQKLNVEKNGIYLQIENIIKEIIELQKEKEQFGYVIEEVYPNINFIGGGYENSKRREKISERG